MLDYLYSTLLDLNHLAVLVAALLSYLAGWLWYSPLMFGNLFMKLSKIDLKSTDCKPMWVIMLGGFLVQWLTTYALALMIWGEGNSLTDAITVSVFVWLGFVVTQQMGGILWDNKPWKLFFLNSAHFLVSFVVMALVLTLWS